MKTVKIEQFRDDYCKVCIYKKVCSKIMKNECHTKENEPVIRMLAKMMYGEETDVIF